VFKEAIDIEGAPNVHAIIEKEFKKGKWNGKVKRQ
jgi:hypothetical protein